MPRLTPAELSALADGLRELYAQTEIAPLRETLVRVAARLIPCDVGSYNEIDRATLKPIVALRFPDSAEFRRHVPAFIAHFPDHPITRFTRKTGRTDALKMSDLVSGLQLRDVPIYNEYYRKIGIRHQMVFYFESNGEPTQRAISLNRSGRDFSERDRMLLNLLKPHYRQACHNVNSLTQLRAATRALEQVQSAGSKAMVLVGREGRIEWLSSLGRIWLRNFCRVDCGPDSKLPDPVADWLARGRALRQSAAGCAQLQAPLRIFGTESVLTVALGAEDSEGNSSLILTLGAVQPAATNLRITGLTRRENEILGWIAQAKSNPEIAGILGLSVRTVYKHVENIFPKLGVENRGAAMLRALEASRSTSGAAASG